MRTLSLSSMQNVASTDSRLSRSAQQQTFYSSYMPSKTIVRFESLVQDALKRRRNANTSKVISMSDDFSKGKRGAVLPPDLSKIRITIRLDSDIIGHFKNQVVAAGGGNYQTLINDALRKHLQSDDKELEKRLRKIIREELKKAS
jgi:uncharacterized protein (DUF4415 family)